ncbi:putative beta-1,3 exoglucanase precursor [Drechmeria coniospora]|uniref:Putative beta-1,3 exoglucanase n=1 Tax=Drechmeria coniospora TaxID=98403 RepID=A0A151GH62_DRECN|nr:putative beta-1,3 exoglucanase precursor [Drechmeria coniospora]KYK56443.1 putative beta-1,3 exoglucanase precursor [Drechmeria coniospora]
MGLSSVLAASVLALGLLSPAVSGKCVKRKAHGTNETAVRWTSHERHNAATLGANATAPRNVTKPKLEPPAPESTEWWLSNVARNGAPAFGDEASYAVFRNVKEYGAKGDGRTDDTDAINAAITAGKRCGEGCDSRTTAPALVYFPPGTYVVSRPVIQYYYTQLVGDFKTMPTLKAAPHFVGIAVIDSNPYGPGGVNWWTNQNNFFRQVRNFIIDLTALPMSTGTGIHWQVAQATSLQNIVFNMVRDRGDDNRQQGIFMENGSGGFMTDLTFNGGRFGMWVGNQQFTTRNLSFNDCGTAIYIRWNWVWAFHGISVNNCGVGIDMTSADPLQLVGSVLLLDSTIANTPVGVATVYGPKRAEEGTRGTLVLDNVDVTSNVAAAVQDGATKRTILEGGGVIASWAQGRSYRGADGSPGQGPRPKASKPAALTDSAGRIVTKSKPQYGDVPASRFVSVKASGAVGDGRTDDTEAIRAVFDKVKADEIVYFDHGAYVVTDTVQVPANVRVVGEIWPLILAGGNASFKDQHNPKPVFRVGNPGDVGDVEMQDLMFETLGPQPGAILMEFNVAGKTKGSAGLFDVHFRVGGTAGTGLQSDRCVKTPERTTVPDPACFGAFMLMHVTASASPYLENVWFWVADHELDLADHAQINIYNGRGVLIESTKGAWLWGTASEHSVLSNYQLTKARNVYMSAIQTETAYMQGNPDARVPFATNAAYSDPDFSQCTTERCARTWGVRIRDSRDILIYGGGLYSFFDNYKQTCVNANDCQDDVIAVDGSSVKMFAISTKASVSMVTLDGKAAVLDRDNRNNFCAAVAAFETS